MAFKKRSARISKTFASKAIRLHKRVKPGAVALIVAVLAERRWRKQRTAKGRKRLTSRARSMWLNGKSREAMAAVLLEKLELATRYFGLHPAARTKREKAMVAGLAIYLLVDELERPNRPGPQPKTQLPLPLPPVIESVMTGAPRPRGRPREYPEISEEALVRSVRYVRAGMWGARVGHGFSSVSELKSYLPKMPDDEQRREIDALPLHEALRLLFPHEPEFVQHVQRNWPRIKRRARRRSGG